MERVLSSQRPQKRRRRPPAQAITPDTPIWCPACQREHPASAFNRESRKFSGLQNICREAQARARRTPEGRAAAARRNKRRWADPAYRAKSLEWQQARRSRVGATVDLRRARQRLQAIVAVWKAQGCVDCGYADIRAIDPDHLDSGKKDGNVSRLVQLCASAARIEAELAKCLPRCARCHRRVTQRQRPCNWRSVEKLPPSWRRRLEAQDLNDAIKLERRCADCGWPSGRGGLTGTTCGARRSPGSQRSSPTAAPGATLWKRWTSVTSSARTATASGLQFVGHRPPSP